MDMRHDEAVSSSDANRWAVAPGALAAVDHAIEPDLSNAAPFLALGAATGGRVTVTDWPATTTQPGQVQSQTQGGTQPLNLPNGLQLGYLRDGDTVILRGYAEREGLRIGLGEVRGTVLPAGE